MNYGQGWGHSGDLPIHYPCTENRTFFKLSIKQADWMI